MGHTTVVKKTFGAPSLSKDKRKRKQEQFRPVSRNYIVLYCVFCILGHSTSDYYVPSQTRYKALGYIHTKNRHRLIKEKKEHLTRALVGGLAPLQTFRYISRTAAPIVTKLSVPFRASILHIVTENFSKGYDRLPARDVKVMSCSAAFGPKKGFAGRTVRPTALKIQKNVQNIQGVELLGL